MPKGHAVMMKLEVEGGVGLEEQLNICRGKRLHWTLGWMRFSDQKLSDALAAEQDFEPQVIGRTSRTHRWSLIDQSTTPQGKL